MNDIIQLTAYLDLVFSHNNIDENVEFTYIFIHMNKNFLRSAFKYYDPNKYDKPICCKYKSQLKEWENHYHKVFDFDLNSYINFNDSIYANFA